jgi:hypothetical protein
VDGMIWAAPEIGSNRNWITDVAIDNYIGDKMATEHLSITAVADNLAISDNIGNESGYY